MIWECSIGINNNECTALVGSPVLRGGGGGVDLHMKRVGMIIVLLGGINFGFWSHYLGVLGKTLSHSPHVASKVLLRV